MTMQEVEGSLVRVVYADETDSKSVLALTTRDDLEFEGGEDSESAALSTKRNSRRYRTHNEPTLSVESLLAVDLSAAETAGLVDQNGNLSVATGSRRLRDGSIHLEYLNDEDGEEPDLIQRYRDVEATDVNIDSGATPPLVSWTWVVHGDIHLSLPPDTAWGEGGWSSQGWGGTA